MTESFRDEIVDDSEPEREELRRQRKRTNAPKNPTTTREVIELTDDESEERLLHDTNVIDISDCTSESASSSGMISLSIGTRKTSVARVSPEAEAVQVASTAPRILSPFSPPSAVTDQSVALSHGCMLPSISPNYSEDTDGKINFKQFAFTDPRRPATDPSSRPGPSCKRSSTVIEPTTNIPPKRKAVTKHQFSPDFSDAELAKLTKCVSCNAQWTTRKTAAQKIKHVQSCAKKLSFTNATIRLLIRKEIDSVVAVADNVSDKKGKGKVSVPHPQSPAPKTFYEHVVTDTSPRKKGRRVEVSESVRSVTTTRNAILDRARVVLDSIQYPTEVGINSPAQMPSFRQSTLAQKQPIGARYIIVDSSSSPTNAEKEAGVLPATQAFAPSKFNSVIRHPHELFKPREDILVPSAGDDPRANPKNGPPLNPLDFFPDANSSREHSLPPVLRRNGYANQIVLDGLTQTFRKRCNISDISGSEDSYGRFSEREKDNDDAYLHFHPGTDNQQQFIAPSRSYSPRVATCLPRSLGDVNIVHSPKKDNLKTKETKTKRKGKRVIELEDNYDELWEARMRHAIVQDTNLHLRILRYEPIHFDVFLKLAIDVFSCSASGKLKTHLRKYLDKEAISFYGTEPSGRRR